MLKPHIVIISPALATANNGNWQTASRWMRFLRTHYRITMLDQWRDMACDALIALHARRSAPSIAAFASAFPKRPAVVVLTGTDLYRDIRTDADAQRSLDLATQLVVLQDAGLQELPPALRGKTRVIYQSARSLKPALKPFAQPHVTMIGHLREEKDPRTFMHAARLVRSAGLRMAQIGGALDPALAELASATQREVPHYRWLGNLPHARTRQYLKRSHLLAIPSIMEGGANVIIEAVTSGVPVVASDISGNRGMLGDSYAGYFPVGDSQALADLIDKSVADPHFHARLRLQCDARAALFAPQREQASVLRLMDELLKPERA